METQEPSWASKISNAVPGHRPSAALFCADGNDDWEEERVSAHDRQGLERLLRYCARPPFAADRLEEIDAQRLIYHLLKPCPDGRTDLILSPLELIDRIAALVPPPRQHRHRNSGVRGREANHRFYYRGGGRAGHPGAHRRARHPAQDRLR